MKRLTAVILLMAMTPLAAMQKKSPKGLDDETDSAWQEKMRRQKCEVTVVLATKGIPYPDGIQGYILSCRTAKEMLYNCAKNPNDKRYVTMLKTDRPKHPTRITPDDNISCLDAYRMVDLFSEGIKQ